MMFMKRVVAAPLVLRVAVAYAFDPDEQHIEILDVGAFNEQTGQFLNF